MPSRIRPTRPAARRVARLAALFSLGAVATLGACGDGLPGDFATVVVPGTTTLAIQAGNNQSVPAGGVAATALTVRLADNTGAPMPGVTVTWAVTSGGGTVSPATTVTDVNGIALATFTAGSSAGTTVVTASAGGTSTASFTITVAS